MPKCNSDFHCMLKLPATTLAPDASVSFAVAQVWALDEDAAPDVDAVLAWWASRGATAAAVRDAEVQDWMSWQTPAPPGVDEEMWLHANAVLRMGQVSAIETARRHLEELPLRSGQLRQTSATSIIQAALEIKWIQRAAPVKR